VSHFRGESAHQERRDRRSGERTSHARGKPSGPAADRGIASGERASRGRPSGERASRGQPSGPSPGSARQRCFAANPRLFAGSGRPPRRCSGAGRDRAGRVAGPLQGAL